MKKVLLIIPAYNEEENILKTYKSIVNYNKKNKTNYDVIVINDGSRDNTSEICHKNNIPVIDLIHNLGIGGAVQTGYRYAYYNGYDIAVQFDGDGQHDVRYIKSIIEPIINNNADFVKAAFNRKGGRVTELLAKPLIKIKRPCKSLSLNIAFALSLSSFAVECPSSNCPPKINKELAPQGVLACLANASITIS